MSFFVSPLEKKHLLTQSCFVCVYKSFKGNMSKTLCVSFFGLDFVPTASCLLFPTRVDPQYISDVNAPLWLLEAAQRQWALPQGKWWRLYHSYSTTLALQIFNSRPDRLKRQQNSLNTIKLFKDWQQQSLLPVKFPLPPLSPTPAGLQWTLNGGQ